MIPLREYLEDDSGKALIPIFSASSLSLAFSSVAILGGLVVVTWPWRGMITFMREQRIPYSFPIIFIALLVMHSYINLRIGRGEIATNRHFSRERAQPKFPPSEMLYPFFQYTLITSCLHTGFLLLPGFPIFIFVTTLSGFSLLIMLKACAVVFTASLLCRLFGFLMYLLWGNSSILGYFFARAFLAVTIYISAFWGRPISPIWLILRMELDEAANGFEWMNPYILYMATVLVAIGILSILCHSRIKLRQQKEAAHE